MVHVTYLVRVFDACTDGVIEVNGVSRTKSSDLSKWQQFTLAATALEAKCPVCNCSYLGCDWSWVPVSITKQVKG